MSDGVNNNFRLKRNNFNVINLAQLYVSLKFIYFLFSISITEKSLGSINNSASEIHLVIIGKGYQFLLYHSFYPQPSQVFINGIYRNSCQPYCEFEYEENNVILIFNNIVQSANMMF